METNDFREALGPLYPELGAALPDLQTHAESVIVRVLNAGPDRLREQMLAYYGPDRRSRPREPAGYARLSCLEDAAATP